MPTTKNQSTTDPVARDQAGPARDTRFDAAHEVARGDAASQSPGDTLPGNAMAIDREAAGLPDAPDLGTGRGTLPEVISQYRRQARQLADHLEARQRELDHREAQLNAQLAQHESAARSARLWFQERHHELRERQADIEERETRFGQSEDEQAARTHSDPAGRSAGDGSTEQMAPFVDSDILSPHEIHELRHRIDAREQRLAAAENLLYRGQLDLEAAWQQLHTDREEVEKQTQRERSGVADYRREVEADLENDRQKLARRGSQLELRRAALDQLRAEVLHIQRETLEMRLATEELWASMSRSAPPAAVTQCIARLRAKLAEQHRLQTTDLDKRRQEIEELTTRLTEQHERVAAQRRDLEHWSTQQHREIESQAANLVAREKELELEHQTTTKQRLQWEAERRDLEREIRRLYAEVRRLDAFATLTGG